MHYGVALDWIDSYLRPRSCCVKVNQSVSSQRNLNCSVPQGSCLAPWLYLTYAVTIFEPRHEISNNVVCATSKISDQPAHARSLIRAFASA